MSLRRKDGPAAGRGAVTTASREAARAASVAVVLAAGTTAIPVEIAIAQAAVPSAAAPAWWLSAGLLGGSAQLDGRLADYQWDVLPRVGWGAEALAGTGRFATGVRLWATRTTQRIGVAGEPDPTVRATSIEVVGRGRVASIAGLEVSVNASAGRLHLGYDPDRVTIATSGPPVEVRFDPVDEWIGGGGLGLRRSLGRDWSASLEVDRRVFGLRTAHRNGDEIEVTRETFGDWNARLGLAWLRRL